MPSSHQQKQATTSGTYKDIADHSRASLRSWLAVVAVAAGVFTVTATETMPIGLLHAIAPDLRVSEGVVGLTVTMYGILAGVLAPFLTAATRRFDRRYLLLLILVAFVVGNVFTALTTSYVVLMLCRLVIGFMHGVMWAIVASVAVRLVPARHSVRATTIVFSGISLASVLGVPLGTFVGEWLGWRAAFWGLVVCSGVTLFAIAIMVPAMPPRGEVHLRELPRLLKVANLRVAVSVTAMVVVGNFAAYTYITPYLLDNVGIPSSMISVLLLCYGMAGVAGNFLAGAVVGGHCSLRTVLITFVAGLSGSLVLLLAVGPWKPAAIVLVLTWGITYSALPVGLQTLVFRSVPEAREAATSIYVLAFNVSIALGALFGGIAIDTAEASLPILLGILFCAAALVATLFLRRETPERT